MADEDVQIDASEPQDNQLQDIATAPQVPMKKRPKLDLTVDARERKRGKSMFGLVLGTLNKAKIEDKERSASEAAKKRQMIEQRLQTKLRKETDSVRRAEEAKKDKNTANRKEEELQLKDSIYKLRRTRIPYLANFLLTSDNIPSHESSPHPSSSDPLAPPPRTHPPPLYYLPAILTPAQEAFLNQRKTEVRDAVDKEWENFTQERSEGIEEIHQLRQRVAEELERKKAEQEGGKEGGKESGKEADAIDEDKEMVTDEKPAKHSEEHSAELSVERSKETEPEPAQQMQMDVDGAVTEKEPEKEENKELSERREDPRSGRADEDDALEY